MNKHYITSCLRWLANEIVPFYNNNELPEALKTKIDVFYKSVSNSIDWFNLEENDVQKLGFLNWDETPEEQGVWFIPTWLYHAIPEGMLVFDTKGQPFEFRSETAPKETMYGCLTFGVKLDQESYND